MRSRQPAQRSTERDVEMATLSINDAIDVAAIFLADEAPPRLEDMPGHMRQLTGGWFCPYTGVIRRRIDALEASGFVASTGSGRPLGEAPCPFDAGGDVGLARNECAHCGRLQPIDRLSGG